MEVKRIRCPYCGYRMPIEVGENAVACGLFAKCKGRKCGKRFEIVVPQKKKPKAKTTG